MQQIRICRHRISCGLLHPYGPDCQKLSYTLIHMNKRNAWTISVWLHGNCKWSTHWEPHTEHINKCNARRWHYTYYTDIDQCMHIIICVLVYFMDTSHRCGISSHCGYIQCVHILDPSHKYLLINETAI